MGAIEDDKRYDIFKNAQGDLMIAIKARMEDTNKPKLVYDKGENALLYRNDTSVILLNYIHPEVRDNLAEAKRVLIIEVRDEAIIREYNCPVKVMKKLPLPKDIDEVLNDLSQMKK